MNSIFSMSVQNWSDQNLAVSSVPPCNNSACAMLLATRRHNCSGVSFTFPFSSFNK